MKTNRKLINALSLVTVTLLAVFVLIKSYIPVNYDVKAGDICPSDIFATGEIVDEVTTNELKQQAMELVQPNYEVVLGARSASMTKAEKIMNILRNEQSLDDYSGFTIDSSDYGLVSVMTQEEFDRLVANVKKGLEIIMTQSVSEDNFTQKKNELKTELVKAGIGEGYIDLAYNVAAFCLEVNVKPDYDSYEKAKQESANAVEPVVYRKGAKVIGRGEVIEQKHYEMMLKMGYIKDAASFNIAGHTGRTLIVIVMFLLSWFYISTRHKKFCERYFVAYCFLMAVELLIILAFVVQSSIPYYVAPIIMLPMLVSMLFGSKIAIVSNVMVCIISVLAFDSGSDILVSGLITGSFASVKLSKLKTRSKMFYVTAISAVLGGVLTMAYDAGVHTSVLPAVKNGALSFLSVVIGSVIAMGLVPVTENIFGILTPFRLIEYTNFESPLLKKMIVEAPGTYHHCLMVGNLAENAANEIGANALLTRAGAYYHDVGKLKRPQMFKENQYSESPHDTLSPQNSAAYIFAHTTDGLELAKKYKLPIELSDFIEQHHGTTLMAYFYHKAKEENPDIKESDFRYKGRKPQSRETAIIMLADTVEAAMRTISEYSYEEMEQFISKLIKTKTDDGQFSECDITFKDLEKIKMSFIYTLKGYFHQRIKYPGQEEKASGNGNGI